MRIAIVMALLWWASPTYSQTLIAGVGWLNSHRQASQSQETLLYARVAIATSSSNYPAILGVEYGVSEFGDNDHRRGDWESDFYGISLGVKLSKYVGAEVYFAQRTDYFFEYVEGEQVDPYDRDRASIVGLSLLLFTHDVSHFTLGYGLSNTFRIGYTVQFTSAKH